MGDKCANREVRVYTVRWWDTMVVKIYKAWQESMVTVHNLRYPTCWDYRRIYRSLRLCEIPWQPHRMGYCYLGSTIIGSCFYTPDSAK